MASAKPATVAETLFVVTIFVGLGVAYWIMLSMCRPYGLGDEVYLKLTSESSYFDGLGLTAAGMTVALVLFDVLYWKNCWWYLARFLIAVDVGLYFLAALAGTQLFAASPIAVYFLVVPIILYMLKSTVLQSMHAIAFLYAVGVGLLVVSFTSLGVWLAYAFGYGNFWTDSTRVDYFTRLGCLPPADTTLYIHNETAATAYLDMFNSSLGGVRKTCQEGFLYWIAPLILVIFCAVMAMAVLTIVHSERSAAKGKSKVDIQVRAFLTFLMLGFLGLWMATSIGGANQGLSEVVFTFTFLLMVIGCGAIIFVEGMDNLSSTVKRQPLVQRVINFSKSDWMRSLILVLFFPLILVIVPLAFFNQLGRKYLPMTKTLDAEERKLMLSVEVSKRVQAMRKWHWTSVLAKCIWWGILFFSLTVVAARFLNVLFSYIESLLVEYNVSIPAATGIFIGVGFSVHMFPPSELMYPGDLKVTTNMID